jgi:hypothetical protein
MSKISEMIKTRMKIKIVKICKMGKTIKISKMSKITTSFLLAISLSPIFSSSGLTLKVICLVS